MTSTQITITGMSCGNCARAVAAEINALPGVRAVEVDLASGSVRIAHIGPLHRGTLATAVYDAGCELAS